MGDSIESCRVEGARMVKSSLPFASGVESGQASTTCLNHCWSTEETASAERLEEVASLFFSKFLSLRRPSTNFRKGSTASQS